MRRALVRKTDTIGSAPFGSIRKIGQGLGVLRAVTALALVLVMSAPSSQALPADPLRPFEAETCDEARARLHEARQASSLISDQENAEALRLAQEQVLRLCGTDAEPTEHQDAPAGED